MMPLVSVVLADDHVVVLEGLRRVLRRTCSILAAVGDGEALIEAAVRLRPDVIVTDLSMPVLGGSDAIRALRERGVEAGILVLSMHEDPSIVAESLRRGATGFALKDSSGAEIAHAVEEVSGGRRYLSRAISADAVARHLAEGEVNLTLRQRQILRLAAQGYSMKKAASLLGISRRTAESHKLRLMRTLGTHSTAELVQQALRLGVLPSLPAAGKGGATSKV